MIMELQNRQKDWCFGLEIDRQTNDYQYDGSGVPNCA